MTKCARDGCDKEVPPQLKGRKRLYHKPECRRIVNLERAKKSQHEKLYCQDVLDLVNNDVVNDIIDVLNEYKELTLGEIVRRAKRDRTTVIKWLRATQDYNVVIRGKGNMYHLNPAGVQRVKELRTLGGKPGDQTIIVNEPVVLPDSGLTEDEILGEL